MEKALVKVVRFSTEDVIATSGAAPAGPPANAISLLSDPDGDNYTTQSSEWIEANPTFVLNSNTKWIGFTWRDGGPADVYQFASFEAWDDVYGEENVYGQPVNENYYAWFSNGYWVTDQSLCLTYGTLPTE